MGHRKGGMESNFIENIVGRESILRELCWMIYWLFQVAILMQLK